MSVTMDLENWRGTLVDVLICGADGWSVVVPSVICWAEEEPSGPCDADLVIPEDDRWPLGLVVNVDTLGDRLDAQPDDGVPLYDLCLSDGLRVWISACR